MDEAHLGAALRYVALNPVWARLVDRAADWPWSSTRVHLGEIEEDGATFPEPVRSRYPDFATLLAATEDEARTMRLRSAESIGRSLGNAGFIEGLEGISGRKLKAAPPGRKRKIRALSP